MTTSGGVPADAFAWAARASRARMMRAQQLARAPECHLAQHRESQRRALDASRSAARRAALESRLRASGSPIAWPAGITSACDRDAMVNELYLTVCSGRSPGPRRRWCRRFLSKARAVGDRDGAARCARGLRASSGRPSRPRSRAMSPSCLGVYARSGRQLLLAPRVPRTPYERGVRSACLCRARRSRKCWRPAACSSAARPSSTACRREHASGPCSGSRSIRRPRWSGCTTAALRSFPVRPHPVLHVPDQGDRAGAPAASACTHGECRGLRRVASRGTHRRPRCPDQQRVRDGRSSLHAPGAGRRAGWIPTSTCAWGSSTIASRSRARCSPIPA